jgi:hypothetical protein
LGVLALFSCFSLFSFKNGYFSAGATTLMVHLIRIQLLFLSIVVSPPGVGPTRHPRKVDLNFSNSDMLYFAFSPTTRATPPSLLVAPLSAITLVVSMFVFG